MIIVIVNSSITWIDRTPYEESNFYRRMADRIDSLQNSLIPTVPDSVSIGWSKVPLVPDTNLPLAGYGARDPMEMQGIHDSTFIRTIVLTNGNSKAAIVSADLLIIHPEVRLALANVIEDSDWTLDEIFLTATHTHSGIGAWAPGPVGKMFAGEYDRTVVDWITRHIVKSINEAASTTSKGGLAYGELSVPDLIKNRLVGLRGTTDPLLKILLMQNERGKGIHGIYGAHATCLDMNFTELSGDYPAYFNAALEIKSEVDYAGFSAGAVGSMGPADLNVKNLDKARRIGVSLADQTSMLMMLGPPFTYIGSIRSYSIELELRDPQVKISQNLRIRPWLFESLFGDYSQKLSILQINDLLIVGTPCDFSGELSTPLYKYARSKGLNLIITSFNGGYIGYVTADSWYDQNKYETRTMNWFGFDTGAYLSEIITKIVDIHTN